VKFGAAPTPLTAVKLAVDASTSGLHKASDKGRVGRVTVVHHENAPATAVGPIAHRAIEVKLNGAVRIRGEFGNEE
jgi:hypothetical protein